MAALSLFRSKFLGERDSNGYDFRTISILQSFRQITNIRQSRESYPLKTVRLFTERKCKLDFKDSFVFTRVENDSFLVVRKGIEPDRPCNTAIRDHSCRFNGSARLELDLRLDIFLISVRRNEGTRRCGRIRRALLHGMNSTVGRRGRTYFS